MTRQTHKPAGQLRLAGIPRSPVKAAVRWQWVALALVPVVLATVLRLYNLGAAALRADTILFWQFCRNPALTTWMIYTDWLRIAGENTGQMPFSVSVTRAMIDGLHLPITEYTLRLPAALFGSLAVLAAYAVGKDMHGRRFGMLLALCLALNPYQIQASMEAYFYGPLLLGSWLLVWSAVWGFRHRRWRTRWPVKFYVVSLLGVILSAYSHLSGCWLAMLWAAVVMPVGLWRWRKYRAPGWEVPALLAACALLSVPLLVMPWGAPDFIKNVMGAGNKAEVVRRMGGYDGDWWRVAWTFVQGAGWGSTPWRQLLTGALALPLLANLLLRARRFRVEWVLLGITVGGIALLHFASLAQGTPPARRYLLYVQPSFLALMAAGAWTFSRLPGVRRVPTVVRRAAAWGFAGLALAALITPAWTATRITGKPTPYKDIVAWVDTHLPKGTLVLVDRWFEPWNELAVYPATNATFTFTVPSEPSDVAVRNRWRETVPAFFERFPDAAYLPLVNSYQDTPALGPWDWPERHFCRRVMIVNEAGLRLRDWGLAYRDDFYSAGTNRVVVEILYNTREDVLAGARAEGRPLIVLYGPEWGYTKLWNRGRPGDFRDWRVLTDRATVDLFNLTPTLTNVTVMIKAVAVGTTTRVRLSTGDEAVFPVGQLREWRIPGIVLQPGANTVELTRSGRDVPHAAVLVEDLRLE